MTLAQALVADLESEDPQKCLDAAVALGRCGEETAVERLVAVLDDRYKADIHASVIEALGRIGNGASVERLQRCLEDESCEDEACGPLGYCGASPRCRLFRTPSFCAEGRSEDGVAWCEVFHDNGFSRTTCRATRPAACPRAPAGRWKTARLACQPPPS